MRSKLRRLIILMALMSISSSAACQVLLGRVVNKRSGAPLRQIELVLVPDTTRTTDVFVVLAKTTTDTSGVFYLDAPKTGTYRLAFFLPTQTMLSNVITIADAELQSEFVLDVSDDPPTYYEFQVQKPVRALPNQPAPSYPEEMRRSGIQGEVLAQFVVDTLGHADMSTFKVLRSTHEEFTYAVRITLPKIKFFPAELNQRRVRQMVQMPFHFCFNRSAPGSPRPDTGAYWWVPKVSGGVCSQ